MAYISYNQTWESEFYNKVTAKDKVQDITLNQIKIEVIDTYKKDEKIPTKFETPNDEDVRNKGYLDKNSSKVEAHI